MEDDLFKFDSSRHLVNYLAEHPIFCKEYLGLMNKQHLIMAENQLISLFKNHALKEFKESTKQKFGDLGTIKPSINELLSRIKTYDSTFVLPKVYTLVSGFHFEKDLLVSDSIIAISLDYFIGKSAKYRPPYFNYFLERYEPEYIAPMIALGISSKFNAVNLEDETMLANMIYYGKAIYFTKKMMPCTADSLIVMYSKKELEEVGKNSKIIWSHFIDKKLLYETNRHIIDKYVGESPKVNEIGEKCPGRIGRWLGWQIVEHYMNNHPEISTYEFMKEKDAQKIFSQSRYRPQE
jgi:hypothetical protein